MRLIALFFVTVFVTAAIAFAQVSSNPVTVQATVINNITAGPGGYIDNRSTFTRQNNMHSFCATGTGTWSVQAQYSDISSTGPWTNFSNPGSSVTSASSSCVGLGIGYHQFILFSFSGTASVNYSGIKSIYLSPPFTASGSGSVTNVLWASLPSWLVGSVATSTTTPALTISPATSQTSHQVIGTCGTATTFTPCPLTLGDLPAITGPSLLGNISSTAPPSALTPTQVTAMLNVFTSSLQGLAPPSSGGSVNFLRADGIWASPAGASLFSSYQFGNQTPITTSGSYIQTTYPSILTTTQTGAGSSVSPYIDAIGLATQSSSTLLAGPCGSSGSPSFRALCLGDLPSIGSDTVLGNPTGSSAAPAALSQAQLTVLVNTFTTSLSGAVPASGGGTTNFLRADGAFAAPPGGGGATAINQLTDAVFTRTSNTVSTCSFPSGGTNFGDSSYSATFSTNCTITLASPAAGSSTSFYIYWNPNSPSTVLVDTSGANFTGVSCNSGCTLVNASASAFLADMKPIAILTAGTTTPNQWDAFSTCLPTNASGCTDERAALSTTVTIPGTNLTSSVDSHGRKTVSLDPTSSLAWTGASSFLNASSTSPMQGASSNPSTCAVGQFYFNTTSGLTFSCTASNTWTEVGSSGGAIVVDQIFMPPFILNPSGGEQVTCDAGGTTPASTYGNGLWDLVQNDTNTCAFDLYLPSTYIASSFKLEILYDGPNPSNSGLGTFQLSMNTALYGAGKDPTSPAYTANTTSALTAPGYVNALTSTGLLTLSLPASPAGNSVRIKIARVSGGTTDTVGISRLHYQYQHN